jgi:hypothetical protein
MKNAQPKTTLSSLQREIVNTVSAKFSEFKQSQIETITLNADNSVSKKSESVENVIPLINHIKILPLRLGQYARVSGVSLNFMNAVTTQSQFRSFELDRLYSVSSMTFTFLTQQIYLFDCCYDQAYKYLQPKILLSDELSSEQRHCTISRESENELEWLRVAQTSHFHAAKCSVLAVNSEYKTVSVMFQQRTALSFEIVGKVMRRTLDREQFALAPDLDRELLLKRNTPFIGTAETQIVKFSDESFTSLVADGTLYVGAQLTLPVFVSDTIEPVQGDEFESSFRPKHYKVDMYSKPLYDPDDVVKERHRGFWQWKLHSPSLAKSLRDAAFI